MVSQICNGCFTQVSELWPMGLLIKGIDRNNVHAMFRRSTVITLNVRTGKPE